MTTQRFKFTSGMDTTITIDVDTTVMTPELASEINSFWSGAEEVLDASDGDVIQAAARRAVPSLLHYLMDGWKPGYAQEQLGKQEGFPEQHGITIVDYDVPDFDAADLVLEQE